MEKSGKIIFFFQGQGKVRKFDFLYRHSFCKRVTLLAKARSFQNVSAKVLISVASLLAFLFVWFFLLKDLLFVVSENWFGVSE